MTERYVVTFVSEAGNLLPVEVESTVPFDESEERHMEIFDAALAANSDVDADEWDILSLEHGDIMLNW